MISLTQDLSLLTLLATVTLTTCLVAISWIDAVSLRIPDMLSLPLIALGLCWAVLQAEPSVPSHLIGAALGYGVLALIGEAYFRRNGAEGLGLGDAKLFASAGAWLGWQALPLVLLISAASGLIYAFARKALSPSESAQVAFGPWLAFGLWVVWIWQQVLPLV